MESLLSIWKRHETGGSTPDNWGKYPHWFRSHESMIAEAESYAASLFALEDGERAFLVRGHIEMLRREWVRLYEACNDGEARAKQEEQALHPGEWATGAAAKYREEHGKHIRSNSRGSVAVALQYFGEYVAQALEAFGVEWEQRSKSEARETTPGGVALPMELDTDTARAVFKEAMARGLMDENYNWRYGLQMLSCFARDMSLHLHLGKGVNADGTERISWRPFETLFKLKPGTLRSNYNDIQKTGQAPNGAYLIDRLFK